MEYLHDINRLRQNWNDIERFHLILVSLCGKPMEINVVHKLKPILRGTHIFKLAGKISIYALDRSNEDLRDSQWIIRREASYSCTKKLEAGEFKFVDALH
jgi:hypothetical protein